MAAWRKLSLMTCSRSRTQMIFLVIQVYRSGAKTCINRPRSRSLTPSKSSLSTHTLHAHYLSLGLPACNVKPTSRRNPSPLCASSPVLCIHLCTRAISAISIGALFTVKSSVLGASDVYPRGAHSLSLNNALRAGKIDRKGREYVMHTRAALKERTASRYIHVHTRGVSCCFLPRSSRLALYVCDVLTYAINRERERATCEDT